MRKMIKRGIAVILALTMIIPLCPNVQDGVVNADDQTPYVISKGRPVTASSAKGNAAAEYVVDGDSSTKWESEWQQDPQELYVDIGSSADITSVYINWEAAYGKAYEIQVSEDEETWNTVYTETNSNGGEDTIEITAKARYVKIYMTSRALTAYGYSIYEFQVYGLNGVVKRPVDYGQNIAQGKSVKSSGLRDEWWMYDDNGKIIPGQLNSVKESNAVDGKGETSFTSYQDDNQWITVDLGQNYDIGRIIVNWTGDAAKVYDYQVSSDNNSWTTVYRQKRGHGYFEDNQQVYAEGVRYVRIYGYTRVESGSGIGIYELSVYQYKDSDEKVTNEIEELDQAEVINSTTGKGSYLKNSMYNEKAKLPTYIDEDSIQTPIASNDWWQSSIINRFGNLMSLLPFKAKYSKKGFEILTATEGWLPTMGATDVNVSVVSEDDTDICILPENYDTTSGYDQVSGYGDYSVNMDLCDENGKQMTSTLVKGSPYIFTEYNKNTVVFVSSSNITSIFDDNGEELLTQTAAEEKDHIGIEITDSENKEGTNTSKSYYCLTVPEGTTFQKRSGKIKITFPSATENYMSIGTMTSKSDLNVYYQHGYAFVTDTQATYNYNDKTAKVNSVYTVTTELKRTGFSDVTMQCMLPHQWKFSNEAGDTVATYTSVRGDLKAIWDNSFSTTQEFAGLLPTFAKPDSEDFDSAQCVKYLETLKAATANITPAADAYWEGKNVHPLAIGALMADQIGETELRDVFIARAKKILVDWFTYTGEDDISFFVYNQNWGTLYYAVSEFGANAAICDHHFTYGYFMFGAAVVAMYDEEFYNDYKEMIEMLVRDYANPSDSDDMFCEFRAFDQYEGHSWAGGYADSDGGNNQESASESLFSWVGMYLWGILTQEDTYRDAGVYGFTVEMEAVAQYWFDYDKINWVEDYPYEVVGQVYGGSNFYGTFFGGQPLYIYGIQWLPISEYLTYYGMDQTRSAEIYQALLDDTATAMDKAVIVANNEGKTQDEINKLLDDYPQADTGWQHITWPFLSQTNPGLAMEKFRANDTKLQTTDQAITYWFINSMDQLGVRTTDILGTGDIACSVYYNEATDKYTAECWNPTNSAQTVTFIDNTGSQLGTASVGAKSLVSFIVDKEEQFAYEQVSTPKFRSTALADGTVTEGVSGIAEFDDTQLLEISCDNSDAVIYYTTDGTVPTTESEVYSGRILVSSDMTIKVIAVKEGCIDSAYASAAFKINGDNVQSSTNLASSATATATTENGVNSAAAAIDGDESTRWESIFTEDKEASDNQQLTIDLRSIQAINTTKIKWETAYASKYEIQVSKDGEKWSTAATENGNAGWVETVFGAVNARYVKVVGLGRGSAFGYSIYEMEIYGAEKAKSPTISPISGIYAEAQQVILSTSVKGAEIKYTLDGTEPTENSDTYIEPFTVSKSTIIKAATYRKGMILSDATDSSVIISGTVSINMISANVAIGNKKQLAAITDENVTWSSDNENIATVNADGLVTGVSEGTANITASINGDSAVCTVTVLPAVHLTSISLSSSEMTMNPRTSNTLNVTFNPENTTDDTTVTWKSSDDSIATVNSAGTITAIKEGNVTITASCGNITSTCEVSVVLRPVSERVASSETNLALNKDVRITSIENSEGSQDALTLTNGDLTDLYLSTSWTDYSDPEYITINLGRLYDSNVIGSVVTQYKNDPLVFCQNYDIQYSGDGRNFVTVKSVTEVDFSNTDSGLVDDRIANAAEKIAEVKYVRIVLNGHKAYGYQIREVAVLIADGVTIEPELEKGVGLAIQGYQMSAAFGGVDGNMGFRTVYSVEPEVDGQAVEEAGVVYGLLYGNEPIIEEDMIVGSESTFVASYKATPAGILNAQMGSSKTATYYARTMNVSNMNAEGYKVSYWIRVYAKLSDGSYSYSKIKKYNIFDVSKKIYDSRLMSTNAGHQYLYNKILKKVDSNYPTVDFEWNNSIIKPDDIK